MKWRIVWFVMPENVSHTNRAFSFLTTRLHPHVPIIIIIIIHGLGRLTCSGIDALPSFPGASTMSSLVPSSWNMCSADILLQPFYCETEYMFALRSWLSYLFPWRLTHFLHACFRFDLCQWIFFDAKYYSCSSVSFGWFPGVWILCADVSEHSSIFIGGVEAYTAYEDGTECFEPWAYKI